MLDSDFPCHDIVCSGMHLLAFSCQAYHEKKKTKGVKRKDWWANRTGTLHFSCHQRMAILHGTGFLAAPRGSGQRSSNKCFNGLKQTGNICHVCDACLNNAPAKMGLPSPPAIGMDPDENKPVFLAKQSGVCRQVRSSRRWEAALACILLYQTSQQPAFL